MVKKKVKKESFCSYSQIKIKNKKMLFKMEYQLKLIAIDNPCKLCRNKMCNNRRHNIVS